MTGTRLRKWGNSQGVLIPKNYCDVLGVKPGDELDIQLKDNVITIQPASHFTLQALMAGYDGPLPNEYDWGKPKGSELW